jgi:hypothetical protein
MKPRVLFTLLGSIVLIAILGSAGIALAEQCSGYDVLVSQVSETTELAKGHTITAIRAHSMIVTDNPASKYNLTIGECSGSLVNTPDGKTKGAGACARRDKDGDTYSIEWATTPGAERGTWKTVAGTGKFAGKLDSGWSQNVAADGKVFAVKWGGTCQ